MAGADAQRFKLKALSNLQYPISELPQIDPITLSFVPQPNDIAIAAIENPAEFPAPPFHASFVLADSLPAARFEAKAGYIEDVDTKV